MTRDEMLNRLIDILTDCSIDGMQPVEWVYTVLLTCQEDQVEADKAEDPQAWWEAVRISMLTVMRIRLLLERYAKSLPVAIAVAEEPPPYTEEIPF